LGGMGKIAFEGTRVVRFTSVSKRSYVHYPRPYRTFMYTYTRIHIHAHTLLFHRPSRDEREDDAMQGNAMRGRRREIIIQPTQRRAFPSFPVR
jgi:hypothetical protein